MTKEEIRQKAIECARAISQNCGKPCVECEYGEYFYGDIPCLTVNGYEHGFADGVAEGEEMALAKHDKEVVRKFAKWFAKCSKVSEPILEHTVNRWIEDYEEDQKGEEA